MSPLVRITDFCVAVEVKKSRFANCGILMIFFKIKTTVKTTSFVSTSHLS